MKVTAPRTLHARWLGRVGYEEAHDLQRALHARSELDHLLLLEHPHVYTLGTRAHPEHVLVAPASVGASLVTTDRGGDVTYHGPGQLVGYPIVTLPEWRDGEADVVAYVRSLEDALIATLQTLGLASARRAEGYTGVWVGSDDEPRKIAAIGVKVTRGRTMHGFALNVDPDLSMFGHIVPCGIRDLGVTSIAAEVSPAPDMRLVADTVVRELAGRLGFGAADRSDVVWRESPADLSAFSREAAGGGTQLGEEPAGTPVRLLGRLAEAGVQADGAADFRRPEWMKVRANLGSGYRDLKRLMRGLELTTVCEEAGCPNIYECWSDGTATFMILGERCTRACGFCLVDTRKPLPPDTAEPERVADAVARMGLAHAVVTSVARDDLDDGGASAFVATIDAVRRRTPGVAIEVLVPDCKGDAAAQAAIFDARPDILNHNIETVARLQRAARPSAGYARSLTLLARAKAAGLTTKSGIVAGMGETFDEIRSTLVDLRGVGVDIVTIGQYLRPSAKHLPVARWWHPDEFAAMADFGEALGIAHVEAGPLVRSSYHARQAADAAGEPHAERAASKAS